MSQWEVESTFATKSLWATPAPAPSTCFSWARSSPTPTPPPAAHLRLLKAYPFLEPSLSVAQKAFYEARIKHEVYRNITEQFGPTTKSMLSRYLEGPKKEKQRLLRDLSPTFAKTFPGSDLPCLLNYGSARESLVDGNYCLVDETQREKIVVLSNGRAYAGSGESFSYIISEGLLITRSGITVAKFDEGVPLNPVYQCGYGGEFYYRGELQNLQRSNGIYNGSQAGRNYLYSGEFENEMPSGSGVFQEGSTCRAGEWEEGVLQEGAQLTNEYCYVGQFRSGRREGRGAIDLGGTVTVGQFKEGKCVQVYGVVREQ